MKDIKESILGSMNMGDETYKPQIEQWIRQNYGLFNGERTINDQFRIDAPNTDMVIDDTIPAYIRFGKVKSLTISDSKSKSLDEMPLPTECDHISFISCKEITNLKCKDKVIVNGNIRIEDCQKLTSLEGIENFQIINTSYIIIKDCSKIKDISQLPDISSLRISDCYLLTNIEIKNKIDYLVVNNCAKLKGINGLPNEMKNIEIIACPTFTDIKSFPKKVDNVVKVVKCGKNFKEDDLKCKAKNFVLQ